MTPQKGYEDLLAAMPRVLADHPDTTVLLIGDGDHRPYLENVAGDLGISDNVHFTGYVDSVYPYLPLFDIGVFPSRWEGFGLTVAEAMVAGLPIVATTIDPFDTVVGSDGVRVEPDNAGELASALSGLLDESERRAALGERSYERVREKFSIERVAGEYADLYRDLAQ